MEAAGILSARRKEDEVSEAERIVKDREPTAHEHWKQGEMPICEIITAKGKQLGYARNVSWRSLPETIDAAWKDAAYRIEGK
ncbi:MAG: hypothetical protein ABSG10_05390 [Terracidiphilus sp.]